MPAERTVAALVSEVRFGVVYGGMNEALWSHLDTCLNFIQVLAGSFAVAGLFSDPIMAKIAGGALAVVTGVQIGLGPLKRSIAFRDARIRFHQLAGRAWSMQLPELEVALEDLRAAAPRGLRALENPAWNVVVQSLDANATPYKLSRVESIAQALAW